MRRPISRADDRFLALYVPPIGLEPILEGFTVLIECKPRPSQVCSQGGTSANGHLKSPAGIVLV